MQIAYSKTREQFPLSYKKIIKKTIASTIVITGLLLVIWGALAFSFYQVEFGWLSVVTFCISVFLALIIFLTYLYQRWYFAVYFYDLTDDFIQIKKGPITPREITIPYERIQDVYVDQDLLDRFLGLYDVHLSSATISSGIEAHIDGVEKEAAEGLRNALLKTVQQRISRNRNTNIPANNPVSQDL
ncbi:PH domain-containing protein [Patescibacteria group bacterium]|nr:PH domain-containing protein [Patescibacteria group bacterium]